MTVRIVHGNALNLPLDDDSVDLVVTSPPYFGLRSYQDGGGHYDGQVGSEATPAEFVDALIAATREMVRVVKPTGSIWVNLGDKYANDSKWGGATGGKHVKALHGASGIGRAKVATGMPPKSLTGIPWRYAIRCIDELGLVLRAEVIWDKPNGLPESVRDRVRRSHEQWFHFTLSPRYYANVDEVREPHTDTSAHAMNRRNRTDARLDHTGSGQTSAANPLGKLPGSVWSIPTQPLRVPAELGIDHFAAFPMEWPRRIITGWCPPGGTVLDPFGGTGTTALVADVLGRDGISVDLSSDYCRLAQWRVADPKERARVLKQKAPAPIEPAIPQEDLFGGAA